jgi:predicted transposase/invertase (TIGR01784 family)
MKGRAEGLSKGLAEGLKKGLEKGRIEGKAEERTQIAKSLLLKNIPIDIIAETTGLSLQDIAELQL